MSVTRCTCAAPHVEKVRTSPISIFGEGEAWRAAKPGGLYIAGHGFHFKTEEAAMEYAFGPSPEQELADEFERNEH
ncbi:hypothetical protein [Paenarthrobacter ureafaciens]|uniref:hypothetical protein n=1 Tax=Paenarthrobacter ureafaciens TaxID=37931 RepID=UPI0009AC9DB4|nr:hypothetical protein [Paenarthrobacter ureafaciens]GLU58593.1 hypothetical protein Pure01_11060 [Paenarthrobacter ureafaciens]GLU61838.1 hypothetical protein Pure02_00880 [Paenarthrobacter ureafaciens]GLU66112.1 hypothetical protein Pure03_00880 [Paenarthrobacter ureafaciens]GLU71564.1 hypothetical protein Pure04_12790 [Paenarthrobacter ureafaciens]GLU74649.1 hypothetical protein Pure05_00890 [Paenarthrobacter ureafaciens]